MHRNVVRRQSGGGSGAAAVPRLGRPGWSRGLGGTRRTPRTRAARRADSGLRNPEQITSPRCRHERRGKSVGWNWPSPVAWADAAAIDALRAPRFPRVVLSSADVVATAGRPGPSSRLLDPPITFRPAPAVPRTVECCRNGQTARRMRESGRNTDWPAGSTVCGFHGGRNQCRSGSALCACVARSTC